MKVAVGVMLLGALLAGSAHASGASAAPSLSKDYPVPTAPSARKYNKPMQSKKAEHSDKIVAIEAGSKAKKPESVTETPPKAADESVQLKGVRG